GEGDRAVLDVHRVRVLQPDPPTTGEPRADARVPRVEQRGQAGLLDRLADGGERGGVGEEALDVGVELEAAHGGVADQPAHLADGVRAVRVDAREGNEDVRVR